MQTTEKFHGENSAGEKKKAVLGFMILAALTRLYLGSKLGEYGPDPLMLGEV